MTCRLYLSGKFYSWIEKEKKISHLFFCCWKNKGGMVRNYYFDYQKILPVKNMSSMKRKGALGSEAAIPILPASSGPE